MLLSKALQELAHWTALTAFRLFQAPADATDAFQEFLIIEKLLICLGTLHHNFRLPIDGKDNGPPGLFQVLNVLSRVALEVTESVDVGEMHCHNIQFT